MAVLSNEVLAKLAVVADFSLVLPGQGKAELLLLIQMGAVGAGVIAIYPLD